MYGKTKHNGDLQVLEILGDSAFIIRTSWLYSSHGNNFVKTMLNLMKTREERQQNWQTEAQPSCKI